MSIGLLWVLPEILMCIRNLVESHSIHFYSFWILSKLHVDVPHVDFEFVGIVEHSVLCDNQVSVDRFRIHLAGCVLACQVKQHL